MATGKLTLAAACMVAALVVMEAALSAEAKVSCGDAVNTLIPCGSYLVGAGSPNPTADCCRSAKTLDKMAATTADRRDVCECFKQTGPSFGVVPARAQRLPQSCKLKLKVSLSPNVDCKTI